MSLSTSFATPRATLATRFGHDVTLASPHERDNRTAVEFVRQFVGRNKSVAAIRHEPMAAHRRRRHTWQDHDLVSIGEDRPWA